MTSIEGVGDLINADTEQQRLQAVEQMSGRLEELYEGWRKQILTALATVEALIDFGEDTDLWDIASLLEDAAKSLDSTVSAMERHLNDGRRGELLREGISVSITGPPNAGKSSLLNMLCEFHECTPHSLFLARLRLLSLSLCVSLSLSHRPHTPASPYTPIL